MPLNLKQNSILVFGPFRLDAGERLLFCNNEEIPLPPKVFDTLLVLVEHQGRVLEKNYLMKTLWPDSFVEESSLARNISLLRKTFGEHPEDQRFIQTIPRRGYRFVATVQTVDELGSLHQEFQPSARMEALPENGSVAASGEVAIPTPAVQVSVPSTEKIPQHFFLYASLACLAVAVTTSTVVWMMARVPPPRVTHTAVVLPVEHRMLPSQDVPMALSPDGEHLVYVAQQGVDLPRLYVRALSEPIGRPLAGTERANHPFFSPDGQWIGFFSGGSLKRVSLAGGAVVMICRTPAALRGASWGSDNRIIFGTDGSAGLYVVSADGGTPEILTTPTSEEGTASHRWPNILPGGDAVLFAIGNEGDYDNANIAVQRRGESKHTVLLKGGTFPHYLPTEHLVYSRAGSVFAAPIDLRRLEVRSPPVVVVENVLAPTSPIGAASFNLSESGTLTYVPYRTEGAAMRLVWVDRTGSAVELENANARGLEAASSPRLSPDNSLVAIQINDQKRDIWIYSIARGTMVRLTHQGINSNPGWTPDGNRVIYQSTRAGRSNLFTQPTHGRGPEEPLTPTTSATQYPGSFTPDGRLFLYSEIHFKTARDIFFIALEGDRKPQVYLQTPYDETTPRLSPDGRHVAYVSDESGRNEVYVQPFTGSGVKYQISAEGGAEVVWGKTGELFYRSGGRLMAVSVRTHPSLEIGRPRLLFEGNYLLSSGRTANYDVSADGQQFLMLKPAEAHASTPSLINLIQNWSEELKRKAPVK
jgi:serine/threonine-protein kinase